MNRFLAIATTLAAGLTAPGLLAQTPAAAAPAASAPVAPQAIPAKVAVVAFQRGTLATNEGQKLVADLHTKFDPQEKKLEGENTEIQNLQKQLQALPANTSDDERSKRIRTIDEKTKTLQREKEDFDNEQQQDFEAGFTKLLQKVGPVAVKYAQDNGFTMMINVDSQPQNQLPNFIWWAEQTDITQAVINAYNTSSGVAAPPPTAPSATAPRRTTPATPSTGTPKR
jgi:outer membrane protein